MRGLRHVMARQTYALAVIAAGLGLVACGSGGDQSSTSSDQHGRRLADQQIQKTLPGEIDQNPQGFASVRLMRPLNAWRTSSHKNFTEVDAGAATDESSVGILFIFRHEFANARQRAEVVKVIGSGALRITQAPLGSKVETQAQRNGKISFVGSQGVRGALDLSDDTVTLQPPASGD